MFYSVQQILSGSALQRKQHTQSPFLDCRLIGWFRNIALVTCFAGKLPAECIDLEWFRVLKLWALTKHRLSLVVSGHAHVWCIDIRLHCESHLFNKFLPSLFTVMHDFWIIHYSVVKGQLLSFADEESWRVFWFCSCCLAPHSKHIAPADWTDLTDELIAGSYYGTLVFSLLRDWSMYSQETAVLPLVWAIINRLPPLGHETDHWSKVLPESMFLFRQFCFRVANGLNSTVFTHLSFSFFILPGFGPCLVIPCSFSSFFCNVLLWKGAQRTLEVNEVF